jgi:hypothetical protein
LSANPQKIIGLILLLQIRNNLHCASPQINIRKLIGIYLRIAIRIFLKCASPLHKSADFHHISDGIKYLFENSLIYFEPIHVQNHLKFGHMFVQPIYILFSTFLNRII